MGVTDVAGVPGITGVTGVAVAFFLSRVARLSLVIVFWTVSMTLSVVDIGAPGAT